MATRPRFAQRAYPQLDLSGGIQIGTSHLLRKHNEVIASKNASYNNIIGSAKRRDGYEKVAKTIQHGNDSLGANVFRYGSNNKIMVGINNAAGTFATLNYMDTADYWTPIITNAALNTRFQMLNDNNQLYVCGATDNDVFMPLTNISSALVVSTSTNVYTAPACKYIAEYNGSLYAINCYLGGKYYPERFYISSPPLGAITFIQTDQAGLLLQLRVDSTQYLKVGMSVDIYGAGTEAKKISALSIISINKNSNRITFAPTTINVSDNDEIWLTGTKGTVSRFWNTDYKTPETADWEQVPPSKEDKPAFTGWGKNNNRLFLYTANTFMKWDGANLITVSDSIGCVSHESIRNVGSWTLWAHSTGIWGYNDNTGQLKLLSRAIDPYIRAINQGNYPKLSAGVVGKVYKLSIGVIADLDSVTTSTSTSSTSTSSTSSSTSSTSTSSTSTSSTSTSSTTLATTSTSTSSTSSSTSSTSISSTSSSISTSTSSTTTFTEISTKKVIRLCYDFDLNAWWTEEHKREIRYQFNHTMNNYTKPYFTDDTGRLFRDETTNTDNGEPIPMEIEIGRNNMGTDQRKGFMSALVDSEDARGAVIMYSIDGGSFNVLGQINNNIEKLVFPQKDNMIEGRDINYKIIHNDTGDPTIINGITTYYVLIENMVNEGGR
ncbi:hypothetical protein UFOVP1522_11 [uncultured Caudovirales phage]|uniref:Uncharacterized protein n=1 Tax=uncultured Caudovirales phage TaxID=2100421 RepID=A0A6J7X8H8_9CAUD|nr:hypothetical protein UFOVP989_12 [uncultured Caudovirales phage]CAB4181624.1 hypothetical protein UFOVP1075_54 [uncultured Caudovirales phage]CAB4198755.1 hypothetical protein UFOVP1312_46 [uncultured Caudovirales phage]CAB4210455.1 hypothetical protein UFOVP1426_12 [uncultured Caudovirales phage]CAB5227184.1 hypothetical protein UFOVP1522_11 [uncultured Caudovirales phage]